MPVLLLLLQRRSETRSHCAPSLASSSHSSVQPPFFCDDSCASQVCTHFHMGFSSCVSFLLQRHLLLVFRPTHLILDDLISGFLFSPGKVVHICNPSNREIREHFGVSSRPSLSQPYLLKTNKNKKLQILIFIIFAYTPFQMRSHSGWSGG